MTAADTTQPAVQAWEVDAPDGTALYFGCDLTLADELYGLTPGGHLFQAVALHVPAEGQQVAS